MPSHAFLSFLDVPFHNSLNYLFVFLDQLRHTIIESHIKVAPAREVYSARRDVVLRRLDEMGLETVRPEGAFYAFPSIREFGMSSEEFCTRLIKEARVALVPGVFFGAEGFVRLSYCCSMEDIVQGLDRLEGFVSGLRA